MVYADYGHANAEGWFAAAAIYTFSVFVAVAVARESSKF
jgi:hypothetical protein